jgi:hypothetical protein
MTGYLHALAARALGQRSAIRPHTWLRDAWEPQPVAATPPSLEGAGWRSRDDYVAPEAPRPGAPPWRRPNAAAVAHDAAAPDQGAAAEPAAAVDPRRPLQHPAASAHEHAPDVAEAISVEAPASAARPAEPARTDVATAAPHVADPANDRRADPSDGRQQPRRPQRAPATAARPDAESETTRIDGVPARHQPERGAVHDPGRSDERSTGELRAAPASHRHAATRVDANDLDLPAVIARTVQLPTEPGGSAALPPFPHANAPASTVVPAQARTAGEAQPAERPVRDGPVESYPAPQQANVSGAVPMAERRHVAQMREPSTGLQPARLAAARQPEGPTAAARPDESPAAPQRSAPAFAGARAAAAAPMPAPRAVANQRSISAGVAAASLPDVHIHIGRVELAAITAPAVVARERSAPAKTMALTDYLSRRNGRGS